MTIIFIKSNSVLGLGLGLFQSPGLGLGLEGCFLAATSAVFKQNFETTRA